MTPELALTFIAGLSLGLFAGVWCRRHDFHHGRRVGQMEASSESFDLGYLARARDEELVS